MREMQVNAALRDPAWGCAGADEGRLDAQRIGILMVDSTAWPCAVQVKEGIQGLSKKGWGPSAVWVRRKNALSRDSLFLRDDQGALTQWKMRPVPPAAGREIPELLLGGLERRRLPPAQHH